MKLSSSKNSDRVNKPGRALKLKLSGGLYYAY
jgi:hypothetical protein